MKILLGCGDEERDGWVGVDGSPRTRGADVVHDLDAHPWPFPDGVATAIEALDVLEHLADTVAFMDECHRILAPGGRLTVRVPYYRSENAWRDPTHRRAFHPDTFRYFDPRSEWCRRYGRFYTSRFWHVLEAAVDTDDNIVIIATPAEIASSPRTGSSQ